MVYFWGTNNDVSNPYKATDKSNVFTGILQAHWKDSISHNTDLKIHTLYSQFFIIK